jgi:HD-GYP domain-containing protein (c-di-GMP phosphodiesterase class II)
MSEPITIIVAFRNDVISDVYSLAFEGMFNSTVIACSDAAAASKALRANPSATVLIENAITGGPLDAFFLSQATLAKRANVFVLGGDRSALPAELASLRVEFLPESPTMAEVMVKVEAALKTSEQGLEYCRISLKSLLVRSARLRCDVYIKLSGDKYVKVLHSNDGFDISDYERFRVKGVESLYLPRKDFLGLMDDLLSKVTELNRSPELITTDAAINANIAIYQIVNSAFETDGFTPQLQKLTLASVDLAVNTIRKNPKLSELLARLDHNRDSYFSWHSSALSFLSCKLATMLGWHSEPTFYKLALASMVHDLVLSRDELARIQTISELKAAGLSEKDGVAVLKHSIEAAQLVLAIDEVPGDVGFIVEQHHERQDGGGFPRGIDHKDISSISALFIIAHDIVTTMHDAPPEKFEMANFLRLRELEKTYTKGAFGQVFRALMEKASEI